MEWMVENWEYVLIGVMAVDKAVALSPSEWDDLLWTSVKKTIFKLAGKTDESSKQIRCKASKKTWFENLYDQTFGNGGKGNSIKER